MLFWALLASGQITMRKVDGWQTLAEVPFNALTLLPEAITSLRWRCRYTNFYQLRDTAVSRGAKFCSIHASPRLFDSWAPA
jgi:hypothetical protein